MSAGPRRTDAHTTQASVLDRLHRVTEAALAFLELDSLLAALLDRITEILNADFVADVLDATGLGDAITIHRSLADALDAASRPAAQG